MITFNLNIVILSSTAPGSGEGRAGVIDRDLSHDDLGLPIIPARRLKGVLMESAMEVNDVLDSFPGWRAANLLQPQELFGKGGQSQPGPFRLGDAVLHDYEELRRWVLYARNVNHGIQYFNPESVLTAYTEQRSQTAMDPQSGGPVKNSLRITRLLRPGACFYSEGSIEGSGDDWNQKAISTLALACKACRRMGLSRSRGMGRIQVNLECDLLTPNLTPNLTPEQMAQQLTALPSRENL